MSPPTPAPDAEPLLTVTQVAHIMRVSKTTVYRLIDDGTLPAARIDNRLCIPTAALQDHLAQIGLDHV